MNPHQIAKLQSALKNRFTPEAGRLSVQEEMDYQILRFLRDHEGPVGAGKIRTALSGSGPSRSEATRLAVNSASDEEIVVLEDNLVAQKQQLAARRSNAELNRQFHGLHVDLSHNRLPGSMYDLIELNAGLAGFFEQGRVHQGSSLGRDHAHIVRAIKLRDGSLAAAKVCRHIEDTIADMEQYVARYRDVQPKE